MVIITYVLIGLYAVLTGMAGMKQWKEAGYQVRAFLFVIVSAGILVLLFIPNKDWMFILLNLSFFLLHILAVIQGKSTNGRINYSHHMIRFVFHCLIALLVYKFILL